MKYTKKHIINERVLRQLKEHEVFLETLKETKPSRIKNRRQQSKKKQND